MNKKKRYRSIYDALDEVLMGSMDTSGVKAAKERMEEKRKQQADAQRYVTLDKVLDPYADKIRKLENVIKDKAASPGEKESARLAIERLKARAKETK